MGSTQATRAAGRQRETARTIGGVLAAALAGTWMIVAATPAVAAGTYDGYGFTVSGGDATITDYTGTDLAISIPDTVSDETNSYTVTTIGAYAFFGDELTSVSIPDSVTTIDHDAFHNNFLTGVTIPDSVTTIGDSAFLGNQLTSVTIGDHVTTIGASAFEYNRLAEVSIPGSVTSIGDSAFENNDLTEVSISGSVTSIGNDAFDEELGLSRVELGGNAPTVTPATGTYPSFDTSNLDLVVYYRDGATGYGSGATWQGYTIQAVKLSANTDSASYIPRDTVTITGSGVVPDATVSAALGTTALGTTTADNSGAFTITGTLATSTTLGQHHITVTSPFPSGNLTTTLPIDVVGTDRDYTFSVDGSDATITDYTGTDTAITIPNTVSDEDDIGDYTVTDIGSWALNNKGLTAVTIPDTVTTLSDHAFNNNDLTKVTIPNSVTTIGDAAFNENHLTEVTIPDTVATISDRAFNNNDLTEVTIPSSVTTIGDAAFNENHLTEVAIPSSVTTIDNYAFNNNGGLSRVELGGDAPTVTAATGSYPSFDTASGHLVVYYRDGATGYGSGTTWQGYTAQAVKLSASTDSTYYTPGDIVTITGSGVVPEAAVSATIGGTSLGAQTANGAGHFKVTGTLPATTRTGRHHITVTSPFPGADLTATLSITVANPPTVTSEPHHATVTAGKNARFTAAATGYPHPTVRWQVSTNGTTWRDVVNGPHASGTTTDTLTVVKPTTRYSGHRYRAVFTNVAGHAHTTAATLTVTEPPPPRKPNPPVTGPAACPPQPFSDVTDANDHCDNIAWLKTTGITKPADGLYHPLANVTRGSMTAFLFRLTHPGKASPTCTSKPFPDVPTTSVFCGYIQWAKNHHIAFGYSDGHFGPGSTVTRGAMAAFLHRIATGKAAPHCTSKPFTDVPVGNTFCGVITWMKSNHITYGVGAGKYGTTLPVTRQAMASFLHRIYRYTHTR